MAGGALMQTVRCKYGQVNAIWDHRRRHAHGANPILPPAFDKLTLIDHAVCQTRTDERKICIAIDRADGITQPGPADPVHPVQPSESLHDSLSVSTRPP